MPGEMKQKSHTVFRVSFSQFLFGDLARIVIINQLEDQVEILFLSGYQNALVSG